MALLADGDRVCGGKVGDGVVGAMRVVGAMVGLLDGRGVGRGVVVQSTSVEAKGYSKELDDDDKNRKDEIASS